MTEEANKSNSLGALALEEWYNSDACKHLQKASEASVQKAVEKYHMLSEEDKYDMVQAICYIMCKAEKEGVSHRGLMNELGIYPAAFWITELMTVHNALWTEYYSKNQEKNLKDDLESLENFLQKNDKITNESGDFWANK
jgi:hypothetical protein